MAMSYLIFILIKDITLSSRCVDSIVKNISKFSFGIYLSHMVVYRTISIHIYEQLGTDWYYMVLSMILTFSGGWILAFIISLLPFKKYIIG